jgi:hypothetical protein
MKCFHHPTRDAVATCANGCGRALCKQCASKDARPICGRCGPLRPDKISADKAPTSDDAVSVTVEQQFDLKLVFDIIVWLNLVSAYILELRGVELHPLYILPALLWAIYEFHRFFRGSMFQVMPWGGPVAWAVWATIYVLGISLVGALALFIIPFRVLARFTVTFSTMYTVSKRALVRGLKRLLLFLGW